MKRLLSLLAGLAVFALAGPASAHVTVSSADATPGGYGEITFHVPTESSTASTTKIAVSLPAGTPFAQVLVQPHPGWTHKVAETQLPTPITNDDGDQVTSAITQVTWTATDGGVEPGEFDDFVLDVGPFPNVSTMTFGVVQTYSDGKVVKWIESPAPGSTSEPDFPAAVLSLQRITSFTAAPNITVRGSSTDRTARSLAVIALALAAAGLGTAVVVRARSKQYE